MKHGERKTILSKSYNYGSYESEIIHEDVKDNFRLNLRIGDVVYFQNNTKIKYQCNQFAVILNRYKRIKFTPLNKYVDYGIEFMMITGPKKGEIRKKLLITGSPTKFIYR